MISSLLYGVTLYSSRWIFAVEQWSRFHCDLKDLQAWLTESEHKLTASRCTNGQLNIVVAKAYQKVT